MKSFLYSINFLFLCACYNQALPQQTLIAPSTEPHILFLHLKVSKKEAAYEAQIISRQEVVGVLDKKLNGIQAIENQWLISFLDDKKNVLEQVTLDNPLDVHVELADDNGQFQNYAIKKNEAEFFFRVQHNPKFTSFQVEQILPNQKKEKLFSLNL